MNKRSPLLIVMILAALICLPWLGEREFYTRGEPREALVPQKMIETSNWTLPRTFDDRVPSKPPLTHWLIGLSAYLKSFVSGVVAVDEWSARFPAALMSLLFLGLFYRATERYLSSERALHTTLILLTSFEWARGMVSARVDTVLSVLLGIALFALFAFCEKRSISTLLLAVLSLAGATLTKGPVAIVLPAGIIGAFVIFEKRQPAKIITLGFQIFLPALILASIWYQRAYHIGGDDFLSKFWYENVERFASSTEDKPHNHSVFYLALMLLVGLLPWSLLPLRSLAKIRHFKERLYALHPFERYSLWVVFAFFIFFAIPSSKRGVYLLPSFPFAALLLSRYTANESISKLFTGLSKAVVIIVSALFVALPFMLIFAPRLAYGRPAVQDLISYLRAEILFRPLSWFLLAALMVSTVYLLRGRNQQGSFFTRLGFVVCLLIAFAQGPVLNAFAHAVSERRLAEVLRPLPDELYSYGFEYYGTIFYLHRPVSLNGWKTAPNGVILVKKRDFARFREEITKEPSAQFAIIGRSPPSVVRLGDRVWIIRFQRTTDSADLLGQSS